MSQFSLKFLDFDDVTKSKSKRRSNASSAISKRKSQRKSSHLSKSKKSEPSNFQCLLINKLIVLALYLRYVDARNLINETKSKSK